MLNIDPKRYLEFKNNKPYPHIVIDNILNKEFALKLQNEILNAPITDFDRYDNPFEQKWTFRNKNKLPPYCNVLFKYFESKDCINRLSQLVGIPLILDPTKNFWGIHKYDDNDHLDIHVDAGTHPVNKLKKEITFGIYLSKNWKEENNGHLEVWKGTNACNDNAKLIECKAKVLPKFNRCIIFRCTDDSWHGNPIPTNCKNGEKRIFLTLSYLSKRTEFKNKRCKAFFVKLPNEPENKEKDKLRLLRADPIKYKEIYGCGKM